MNFSDKLKGTELGDLITKMTDKYPENRPSFLQILKMPIISKVVQEMLNENYLGDEITAYLKV